MEFNVSSSALTSFEDQTALLLANLRATPQLRQQAISNIPVARDIIIRNLFQPLQPSTASPHSKAGRTAKKGHPIALHSISSADGIQIPHGTDPTRIFPAISGNTYQVSKDITFQKISDRGRNATDFYHLGHRYPYVLVVNRVTGAHSWTLETNTAPSWIKIAMSEVGVREIAGQQNDSRVMEYQHSVNPNVTSDDSDNPWCATFINWVLLKAGLARSGTGKGENGRRAAEFDHYGTGLTRPVFGCIATFSEHGQRHVGFIVGKVTTGQTVNYAVLGGNQSDQVNVQRKPYPTQCRWPVCTEAMGKPEELREYDNRYGFLGANGSTR